MASSRQKRPEHLFPETVVIEDISIEGFPDAKSLFDRVVYEIKRPRKSVIAYLNVHVANMAYKNIRLKGILDDSDCVYCDGAGIRLAARLQGSSLPARLPAADWTFDLFRHLSEAGRSVYLLGGEPGVVDRMLDMIDCHVPGHTVIGGHHGYFLNDPDLEKRVIGHINRVKPDLLIVGFGTPLQELWIDDHKDELDVKAFWPLGAFMDYHVGNLPRCPQWLGDLGFEWLFRLGAEPTRLFSRYVIGNPWFLYRITTAVLREKNLLPLPISIHRD